MLSLARNGYTDAQVNAQLHSPVVEWHFQYNLLDKNNVFKKTLTTVTSGHVGYDTSQKIRRTAKFTMQDDNSVNFLSDRIQPHALLLMSDGGYADFPLGVFILSTPPRVTDPAQVITRQIDAYDLLQVVVDDKVDTRYTVTSGTNYITAVQNILTNAGINQYNLTATSSTLPNTLDWAPGTEKLQIINDLLKAINYRSLWFDENGQAQAIPYQSPSVRAPEYTYQDDDQSVMFPDMTQSLDLFAVPNKWVLVVTEPDRTVLTSTYTNSNANSPTSTTNRGRTIVKYDTSQQAPDQATLDSIAQKMAYEDSQIYEQVEFGTGIMPVHSDLDVFNLNYSTLGITYKVSETTWEFDLVQGARMLHRVQNVVSV